MTTRIKPTSETIDKIKKLVEEGKYKNIHEFVSLAIEKQLESEENNENEIIIESPTIEKNEDDEIGDNTPKNEIFQKLDYVRIENIPKENNITSDTILEKTSVDLQFDLYGPGTSGLIWVFHNRFLPIKIALYNLGLLIGAQKNNWINFNEWKTSTADYAAMISDKLYENEISLTTGLPMPKEKIKAKFTRKKNKTILVFTKSEASKKRFADQFIGRSIKKEKLDREIFSGACIEMGLIRVEKDPITDEFIVAFTETGKDFVLIDNPIIERYRKDFLDGMKEEKAFSKKEREFILEKIIPKYSLEKQLIDKILNLKNKQFTNDDVMKIFKNLKKKYNEEIIFPTKLEKISKQYESEIKKKFMVDFPDEEFEPSNDNSMNWVISRYLDLQPTGILGRLKELGVISREYVGREPHYTIK